MAEHHQIELIFSDAAPLPALEALADVGIEIRSTVMTVPASTHAEAVEIVHTALGPHGASVTVRAGASKPPALAAGGGGWRTPAMVVFRIVAVLAFAAAAFLGHGSKWPSPLVVALEVMVGYVLVESVGYWLWARNYAGQGGSSFPAPSNAYADAAKVAITTQGVVLGLIAFRSPLDTTLKVGNASLAAGVLFSAFLYLNVALGDPVGNGQKFAAAVLFSLAFWSLGFGLVCVVAGNWS